MKLIDLIGKKFGIWTVISKAESINGNTRWDCLCECGNKKTFRGMSLRRNIGTFCECSAADESTKRRLRHGYSGKIDEYRIWICMINRCYNKNDISYLWYGGAGVTICDKWRNDFTLFLEDMGMRPSKNHSIDRIDGSVGYSPENCRWASRSLQSYNQRISSRNKSGIKGVRWREGVSGKKGRWVANINKDRKRYNIGSFENLEDAIIARKEAEIKYWGKSS